MRLASLYRAAAVGAVIAGTLGCGRPDLGVPPQVCSTFAVGEMHSDLMEPGGTCNHCHDSYSGPSFTIAGSVMNASHDDTNCAGVESVTVAITGADGTRVELLTNAHGNFTLNRWPGTSLFPYTAEVTRAGLTSKMLTPRQPGENDCNSCHTAAGLNLAPGRIVPP